MTEGFTHSRNCGSCPCAASMNHALTATHAFQNEVLQKLGSLEAKMDMLVGNGQPGRVRLLEDRVALLERHDIRRTVFDRLVNAGITIILSAMIAMHDHIFRK